MNSRVAAVGPPNGIAALRQTGIDLCTKGFYQEALSAFQKALFLAGEPAVNAEVYCDIGVVYRYLNRLEMADEIFQFILENDPPSRVRVVAHVEQAIVRLRQLDHRSALDKIALADEHELDDVVLQTHLNSTYGRVYFLLSDYDNALAKYNKALSIIRSHDGASAMPIILNNIGDCYVQLGDFPRGEEFNIQALKIAKERKNNRCISECLLSRMDAAMLQGQHEQAKLFGKQSLAIARSFKFGDIIGEVEYRLANIYREEGKENISNFFLNRVLQSHRNLNSEVLNILAKTG
jgi:tetratricopeptide (TPR) repeat protein